MVTHKLFKRIVNKGYKTQWVYVEGSTREEKKDVKRLMKVKINIIKSRDNGKLTQFEIRAYHNRAYSSVQYDINLKRIGDEKYDERTASKNR